MSPRSQLERGHGRAVYAARMLRTRTTPAELHGEHMHQALPCPGLTRHALLPERTGGVATAIARAFIGITLLASSVAAQSHAHADSLSRASERRGGDGTHAALAITGDTALDGLIRVALEQNSTLHAASDRGTAARARVAPARTRPDPNLMAGIITIPVAKPSLTDDNFTMLMVGLQQSFPYPGKLALRAKVATLDASAVDAMVASSRLTTVKRVKEAWYEIAYLDHALEIAERTRAVLVDVVRVTESHYGTGTGLQQDVLKARVEAARLAETASTLSEARVTAVAQLNAVLERATDTPVRNADIPARLARAAVADNATDIRFSAQTLDARAAGSPLPPVATLQAMALAHSPLLLEHEARISAQAARVELARKDSKPDFDVIVQYNHRVAYPDLLTAQVSIPLRLQKSSKQDQAVVEQGAELSALEAEHRAAVHALNARVASLASDIERSRTQLALYVKAILPQGRAAVTSALTTYQSGRADLLTLLDLQGAVFSSETAYFRALSDFAKAVAELEETVGGEVLP